MNASHLGAHFSIAGGLEKALYAAQKLSCNAVQIFTKNARSWKEPVLTPEQVSRFKKVRIETGISYIFSHCTYLINIASDDPRKLDRSRRALQAEMKRSAMLGIDGVVLHPGAHLGQGIDTGLETAKQSIDIVLTKGDGTFPVLLIETTAGSGTCLGSRFEEIARLITGYPDSIGVCLDTSHIFAAGYDIRDMAALERTLDRFDNLIGLSRLKLIHANDSIPDLAARKDRHAHIGKGKIGIEGFRALMTHPALAHIPKILETPKIENSIDMDAVNLNILRQLGN